MYTPILTKPWRTKERRRATQRVVQGDVRRGERGEWEEEGVRTARQKEYRNADKKTRNPLFNFGASTSIYEEGLCTGASTPAGAGVGSRGRLNGRSPPKIEKRKRNKKDETEWKTGGGGKEK